MEHPHADKNTRVEHKYADILRAIADGKEIQYKLTTGAWCTDATSDKSFILERLNGNYAFRIKPEVKTGWIALYENTQPDVVASATHVHPTKEEAIKWANRSPHTVIQISYTPGEGL
jgi:hypothetical protein